MPPNWLLERMETWTDRLSMVHGDHGTTYAQLLALVDGWRSFLAANRILPGHVVAVRADFTPSACALLLALIENSAILVPLTPETSAQPEALFEAAGVDVVLTQQDDAWQLVHRSQPPPHPLIHSLRASGRPGIIALTSGSSGTPKAILHDLTKFMETYREQRRSMCTITFFSFDHLGGVNTLLFVLSSGGTMVPLKARDPEMVCRAIATHRVELLPTSPTFLKLLLISEAYKRYDLSSLKLLTYGTEVMPESTLQQLREALPNVRLQQTYAFSEGPPLRLKAKEPGSLWIKIEGEGVETRIVDGQLWVRSPKTMMGYLNAPTAFDAEGWLNTGDMVEVDGDYLRILGRKSEIINVGGEKVYPAEVENTILQVENIKDVTVQGRANPIIGNIVMATVTLNVPEDPILVEKKVRSFCQTRLSAFKVPAIVRVTDQVLHSKRFKKIREGN